MAIDYYVKHFLLFASVLAQPTLSHIILLSRSSTSRMDVLFKIGTGGTVRWQDDRLIYEWVHICIISIHLFIGVNLFSFAQSFMLAEL